MLEKTARKQTYYTDRKESISNMKPKIIEFKHVNFTYEGCEKRALQDVNFSIDEGSIIFINGKSGSGKSTLLNILNGIIPEVIEGELEGEVLIDGRQNLTIAERSLILGNVFQNPRSQFFTTDTTAELVFAMENYGFPKKEMVCRLHSIIDEFKVAHLQDRSLFGMSSGERQLIALLTVLIMNPKVIIFDEPSANLDYGNAMRLRKQLKTLKKQGKTVIVADHRYFYLQEMVDKFLLIENKTVLCFETEQSFLNSAYRNRSSDLFHSDYGRRKICKTTEIGLKIEHLTYKNILKDINLEVNKHEATTIVGINGVGKTTLAELISGAVKNYDGTITAFDEKSGARKANSIRALYILQDADFQLFGATCLKELEITRKNSAENMLALELLNLDRLKDHHPQSLSGGEKQRLQMAISMVSNNQIIIFDEPTSGLDQASMARVIEMIERLKKDRTIIIISHDYEFIRQVSDTIVYLKDGSICDKFYLEDGNIEKLNTIYKEMEAYYES